MYKINKDIPTIQIFISFFLRSTDGRIRCEKCSTAECRMEMKDQRFLTTNISLTISENLKKIKVFSYGTKVIICFESCVNFGKSKICTAIDMQTQADTYENMKRTHELCGSRRTYVCRFL